MKIEEMNKEEYGTKSYIEEMKVKDARENFRLRTKMFKCKMNQSSDPTNRATLWKCTGCACVDTQAHIMWCPAYQELREGKSLTSDIDVVDYYRKVLAIREKLDLK